MANNFSDAIKLFSAPQDDWYASTEKRGIIECENGRIKEGREIFLDCVKLGTRYGYYLYALTFWPDSKDDFEKYMTCAIDHAGSYPLMALAQYHSSDPWLAGEYIAKAVRNYRYELSLSACKRIAYLYEDADIKFEDELVMVPFLHYLTEQDPAHRQDYEEYIEKAQVRNIWRKAATCPNCKSPKGEITTKKDWGKGASIGMSVGLAMILILCIITHGHTPFGVVLGLFFRFGGIGAIIGAIFSGKTDFCKCPDCGNVWRTKVDYIAIDRIISNKSDSSQ